MSEITKTDKVRRKRGKRSPGRQLLDLNVRSMAAAGQTTVEIAEQLNLARATVSEILNSNETKKLIELGNMRMHLLMTKAIDAIEWAIDNKHEYGVTGHAIKSAITVLKNMGLARENVDLTVRKGKPIIIERKSDGTQVILDTVDEETSEEG